MSPFFTTKYKSRDFKLSAVGDKSQLEICKIFKYSSRSLMKIEQINTVRNLRIEKKY
jgi:hypothetical protein